VVVDASVAAKWFLPPAGETLVAEADDLMKLHANGQLRFLVPDLFWAELANIFGKSVRLGRWKMSSARAALRSSLERKIPTVPTVALLDTAFDIAGTFDRTIYDCLYVALAIASKCSLVTADERLANALAAHLPVKWLGTFT
jgi:predicted nucleic acid-binding protein